MSVNHRALLILGCKTKDIPSNIDTEDIISEYDIDFYKDGKIFGIVLDSIEDYTEITTKAISDDFLTASVEFKNATGIDAKLFLVSDSY